MLLYARLGDAADYQGFKSIAELKDELRNNNINAPYERFDILKYGIQAKGFTGHNYISVYYGKNAGEPIACLSDDELAMLNAA
jgi:hypothetical protein